MQDCGNSSADALELPQFLHQVIDIYTSNPPASFQPDYDYRQAVKMILPQTEILDDEPLVLHTSEPRRTASVFEDDWRLIEEMLEDGTMDDSEESLETVGRWSKMKCVDLW